MDHIYIAAEFAIRTAFSMDGTRKGNDTDAKETTLMTMMNQASLLLRIAFTSWQSWELPLSTHLLTALVFSLVPVGSTP
jgi:hypothetical protein